MGMFSSIFPLQCLVSQWWFQYNVYFYKDLITNTLSLKYEDAIATDMMAQFGPRVQLHQKMALLWYFLTLDKCFYFCIQKLSLSLSNSSRG